MAEYPPYDTGYRPAESQDQKQHQLCMPYCSPTPKYHPSRGTEYDQALQQPESVYTGRWEQPRAPLYRFLPQPAVSKGTSQAPPPYSAGSTKIDKGLRELLEGRVSQTSIEAVTTDQVKRKRRCHFRHKTWLFLILSVAIVASVGAGAYLAIHSGIHMGILDSGTG
ncbi:hypothetical protein HYFRA_00008232 [Hymenoscyphus fraxineus]|uniref:Uncharacterized protein n=1 Tax=Hymenoscyphus fraxineus TaxID=746836 RepID=A0A9N9LAH4_9HELO|nr:hypothetical protein HYFRA_00008232 [Hymenoscyphus fraxineus]